jgi:hypothetical protein
MLCWVELSLPFHFSFTHLQAVTRNSGVMDKGTFMNILRTLGLAIVLFATTEPASAIESLGYQTLEEIDGIEIRQYDEHLLASVTVRGEFNKVGNRAFRPLFNFISGDNSSNTKIAMTAPVIQSSDPQSDAWVVSFVMPSSFDVSSIPAPDSDIVDVVANPAATMAVIEYKGGWNKALYEEHESELLRTLDSTPYIPCSDTMWARHNSPMMPSFWRKNEIMVAVCKRESAAR